MPRSVSAVGVKSRLHSRQQFFAVPCGGGRLPGSNRQPMTFHASYAASRISSNLKGSTKQFGWLQASATKNYSATISSEYTATIRIDKNEDRTPCLSRRRRSRVRVSSLPPHYVGPPSFFLVRKPYRSRTGHDCQDKRRFFSEARATPPPIFGLMTNSSTVTFERST
jgi:hypothetical protein